MMDPVEEFKLLDPDDNIILDWANHSWFRIAMSVFGAVIFTGGICGNILVLCVLIKKRNSRLHGTVYGFLAVLAVGDIVILLTCLPWTITSFYFFQDWTFSGWGCQVIMFFQVFAVLLSMLTLWALAFERYFALVYPIKYKILWRPKYTYWICAIIVFISTLLAIPRTIFGGMLTYRADNESYLSTNHTHKTFCLEDIPDNKYLLYFNSFRVTFLYFVPLITIAILFVKITKELGLSKEQNKHEHTGNLLKFKKKMVKLLIARVVIFAICWLPYHLFLIVQIIPQGKETIATNWFHILVVFTSIFMYLNCISDPILYSLYKDYRIAFRQILCCNYKKDSSFNSSTKSGASSLRLTGNRV